LSFQDQRAREQKSGRDGEMERQYTISRQSKSGNVVVPRSKTIKI
jgi:hypothetical protein